MENFIIIFSLIMGILSIVLFFKLWKMTNDVSELKNFLIRILLNNNETKQHSPTNTESTPNTSLNAEHAYKFSIGDIVKSQVFWGDFIVDGFNEDGTYQITSLRTGEKLIVYEDTLKLKNKNG